MLIASRRDRKSRRRADRRVRVAVRKADAFSRHLVEIRRAILPTAITVKVGVTEIVRQDEDEVGPCGSLGLPWMRPPGISWIGRAHDVSSLRVITQLTC